MSALTANSPRTRKFRVDDYPDESPVAAGVTIFDGSAVSNKKVSSANTGFMQPLVAAEDFTGFCVEQAKNVAGYHGSDGTDGAIRVKHQKSGRILLNVVGVTGPADVEKTVYAASDNDFTLTSTSNSAIGKVALWVAGTQCWVDFEAVTTRSL